MSYYNQPSSYPGAPSQQQQPQQQYQSSYPGGPSFPSAEPQGTVGFPGQHTAQPDYSYNPSSNYNSNDYRGESAASSYYNGAQHSGGPSHQDGQQEQPIQYDEHGNPIPGERGVGTMAMGALGGFAANKMTGGHHGGMASAGTGALLAQGAKMAMDYYKKNKTQNHPSPSQGYGAPYGYQGSPNGPYGGHQNNHNGGGFLGGFGKREA